MFARVKKKDRDRREKREREKVGVVVWVQIYMCTRSSAGARNFFPRPESSRRTAKSEMRAEPLCLVAYA